MRNEQHGNTKGTPIGDENTCTSIKLCTGTRTQSTEPKRTPERKQFQFKNNTARKTKPAVLPTPNTKQYPQCWRCEGPFTPNHNDNCLAKTSQCNIRKTPRHLAKMCRSQIPPLPKNREHKRRRQSNNRTTS